jgi:hypothetical protein
MPIFQKIKKLLALIRRLDKIDFEDLLDSNDLKSTKVNIAQLQAKQNEQFGHIENIQQVEFQVFSQWGEDGIIQYLIHVLDIPHQTFIEFGVEDYQESNTRLLAVLNNWSGLIIDGNEKNLKKFKSSDSVAWRNDVQFLHAFITAENIEHLIRNFLNRGYSSQIGLLSIDIDGMDYWVFKKIESVQPIILILEYNSIFELEPLTIPYADDFVWKNQTGTHQYWGAGLASLHHLATQKGYVFVGCNSAGNNAFFVREDKWVPALPRPTLEDGYVRAKFNEGGAKPNKTLNGKKIRDLELNLPLFNTRTNEIVFSNEG